LESWTWGSNQKEIPQVGRNAKVSSTIQDDQLVNFENWTWSNFGIWKKKKKKFGMTSWSVLEFHLTSWSMILMLIKDF
jgi:hypothetical protein